MRAVCLREPWLYLMLDIEDPVFRKNIENRVRCLTKTMGPILVKSSALKSSDADLLYYFGVHEMVMSWGWFPEYLFPKFEQLQFGGIRGVLNFAELLDPHSLRDSQHRWKFPDCFGYIVDKSLKLPFRRLKGGGQGIFYTDVTNEEAEALSSAGFALPDYAPTERERALT